MRTLCLRDVPDEVVEGLERLAARQGMSLSEVAVRELTQASRRSDDQRVLGELPGLGIPPGDIVDALDADREAR
jgi:hypothetical protein